MTSPAYVQAMARAQNNNRRMHGFASALTKPKEKQKPPVSADPHHVSRREVRLADPVSKEKLILGCIRGVIRNHFDGALIVTLDPTRCWAAARPEDRLKAIATHVVKMTIEHVDNRDNRLCRPSMLENARNARGEKVKVCKPEVLESELIKVLTAALLGHSSKLGITSLSIEPASYSVRTKPVKKQFMGDGRPAKRIERAKEARRLQKMTSVRGARAA